MTTQTWTHTVTQHGTGVKWAVRVTMEGEGRRKHVTRMEQRREGQTRWRTVTQTVRGWCTVPEVTTI